MSFYNAFLHMVCVFYNVFTMYFYIYYMVCVFTTKVFLNRANFEVGPLKTHIIIYMFFYKYNFTTFQPG